QTCALPIFGLLGFGLACGRFGFLARLAFFLSLILRFFSFFRCASGCFSCETFLLFLRFLLRLQAFAFSCLLLCFLNAAFHVSAFLAHLNVHCLGTPLIVGRPQCF